MRDDDDVALGCVMWFMLLSLLVLAVAKVAAAPVSPPPRLTDEMLVGRWDFQWGTQREGWIEFLPDGRYHSRHCPGDPPSYAGLYWVHRGEIVLWERRMMPALEPTDCGTHSTYRIPVSMAKWPLIDGNYLGQRVVFSNPQR